MTVNWRNIKLGLLVVDVVAVNLAAGWLVYRWQADERSQRPVIEFGLKANPDQADVVSVYSREVTDLQIEINRLKERVEELENRPAGAATPAAAEKTIVTVTAPTKTKTRSVQYVTVPGSGSTTANVWTTLAGTEFYFDPADYPGLTEVYFEANMKLFNGNGQARVRLYDSAHGIGVQGSEAVTSAQTDTVVTSGRVSFWAGKNLIKVQAMSLTADTAIYSSGRLKIITIN